MQDLLPPQFILLTGSGSVAAANVPGLTYVLVEHLGLPVVVLLTREARRFVTQDALLHVGGAEVVVYDESSTLTSRPNHIGLASRALGVLVYPASAGFIGKMANGLALDLASTTLLCCYGKPTLIVPSMNSMMWRHPLVQRNLHMLQELGMQIVPTEEGTVPSVYRIQEAFEALLRSTMELTRGKKETMS